LLGFRTIQGGSKRRFIRHTKKQLLSKVRGAVCQRLPMLAAHVSCDLG